jgi:hypothetical protein
VPYKSSESFKQAVYSRLLRVAEQRGLPIHRFQSRFLIERFLLRVFDVFPTAVVKGGMAIEFRLANARNTKDLDLGLDHAPAEHLLAQLQQACDRNFGDWLTFECKNDPHHPVLMAEGMAYSGRRLKAQAILAGRPLFGAFGVDLALKERHTQQPEQLQLQPIIKLELEPSGDFQIPIYALEAHIAEKLHAYTLPRRAVNSRVKDLPDIAILALARDISGQTLKQALRQTFSGRDTHPLPTAIPSPPPEWESRYCQLSKENRLPWADLSGLMAAVSSFLDPLLSGQADSKHWVAELSLWK